MAKVAVMTDATAIDYGRTRAAPHVEALLAHVRSLDEAGRHDDAVAALNAAAAEGHGAAMTVLGERLLVGRNASFEPQQGLALLTRAMEAGDPDATTLMATLTAAGAWIEPSWPRAFDLLQAAAERGSERAQRQLVLLAGDRALAEPIKAGAAPAPDAWARLRQSIDIAYWITPPERRAVCEAPRIRLAEGFTTPEVCDWIIDRARGRLKPALMYDGRETHALDTRTCTDFVFDIVEADLVVLLLRARISNLTKLPTACMEPPQVFHYALGQEIKAHFDHVGGAKSEHDAERIATFLIYLNDAYEGGELNFSRVGFQYKGRKGDAIFFANVDAEGKADRLSLHAALPITLGEKYMFSQWIQNKPTAGR
jgi:hypothetical protein